MRVENPEVLVFSRDQSFRIPILSPARNKKKSRILMEFEIFQTFSLQRKFRISHSKKKDKKFLIS